MAAMVALATLTILEIVLGVDNVIFISILAGKLPLQDQRRARSTGIALAVKALAPVANVAWGSWVTVVPPELPVKSAQDMAFGTDVHPGQTIYWMTDMGWMMGPWLVFGSLLLGLPALVAATVCTPACAAGSPCARGEPNARGGSGPASCSRGCSRSRPTSCSAVA